MKALIKILFLSLGFAASANVMKVKDVNNVLKQCLRQTTANVLPQVLKHKYTFSTADYYNVDEADWSDHQKALTVYLSLDTDYAGCTGGPGRVTIGELGNFDYKKDEDCYASTPVDESFDLWSDDRSMPVVGYETDARTLTYDRLGNRTPDQDPISQLLVFLPSSDFPNLAKVPLTNLNTQHVSQITVDSNSYLKCLQKSLPLTPVEAPKKTQ